MGNNHVAVYQFGIEGAITASATQYLVPGAGATSADELKLRITRAGTLKNMYVRQRVASGAGGRTDIYTARIEGANSAVTCTLDNATEGEDAANTAAIALGDDLSISLVSNDGADTSEDCFVTIEVEFAN